jgi:hypothetical protein
VADVLSRVNYLLKESGTAEASRLWRDSELYLWIDDGQSEIMRAVPDSTSTVKTFTCGAGAKQTLASTDHLLLRVHNLTAFERSVLDLYDPDWEQASNTTPTEYTYDPSRDTRNFYVNPPAAAGSQFPVTVSVRPTNVTGSTSALTIKDEYLPALALYVAHRAMSKQAEYGSAGMEASFLQQFMATIGG